MGSISSEQNFRVKRIAIIGAGPSGLAAAKYLVAEKSFSQIVIFEQRNRIGGLWNHVPEEHVDLTRLSVPQTKANTAPEQPRWDDGHNDGTPYNDKPIFESAVYDRLETNIPRDLMGFSDLDWPRDCQLFPGHEEVLQYLERYAEDVKHLIQFRQQVLNVRLDNDRRWIIKTQKMSSGSESLVMEHTFDAVLIANGHFNVPYVPPARGLEGFSKTYPGSILHSKFYRNPEKYVGKKVIVVGNSASGTDIAAQISRACQLPLLQSQKSESFLQPDATSRILPKPEIVEYIPTDRTVRFSDGTEESDIDAVVYCTGYFYSYPFLKKLPSPIISTGENVENTYQHIFYQPIPTLAFAVLNQKVIPFPLAEAQSAVIARVWAGRLSLPSKEEMKAWEEKHQLESGGGRSFHVLKFPKDADYINMLHDWAKEADDRAPPQHISHSSSNGHVNVGKTPPYWGERQCWTRERFPAIKKAFNGFGENRNTKKTLEDVGFDFDAWKREQFEDEDGKQ